MELRQLKETEERIHWQTGAVEMPYLDMVTGQSFLTTDCLSPTKMNRMRNILPMALICLLLVFGCRRTGELRDFKSDGCSLFPDRSLINEDDWCDCCFDHDIAYWKGGTEEERLLADQALRDCVFEKTGNRELAEAMYAGVRLGGSPYFYSWYRWGYGWDFERKYQELTADELAQVEQKLKEYFEGHAEHPCHH